MQVAGQRHFTFGVCLGRGGFGEVYRATMATSGGISREVAVKLLRSDLDLNDEAVRRLRDEGKLLSRIDHPALLGVHDLVVLDERVALVTEFVDGEDLSACFKATPPMPVRALLQAIGAAADALHAAWNAPIGPGGRALRLVHRDIKPSNLRVSRHGQLKVLDFGIARTDEVTREAKTKTDFIVGSPAYMGPERFLDNEVRSASDVFALGCTLYEGLTGGERLFGGASAMMLSTLALDRDRFEAFVAARPSPRDVPPEVDALMRECLRFDPAARPSAVNLGRRCEELADRLAGPTLARWARERDWPTSVHSKGDLEGRVVTLGTIERAAPAIDPEDRRSMPWIGIALAVGAMLTATLAITAAAGGGAAAWWAGWLEPEAASEVVIDAADVANPGAVPPVGEPQPGPTPSTAPSVSSEVRPTRGPSPSSEPAPIVDVAATPVPAPIAAPPTRPTGSVLLQGDLPDVSLVGDGTVALVVGEAIDVPAGAWRIVAVDAVLGRREFGELVVAPGGALEVNCSAAMSTCRTR